MSFNADRAAPKTRKLAMTAECWPARCNRRRPVATRGNGALVWGVSPVRHKEQNKWDSRLLCYGAIGGGDGAAL